MIELIKALNAYVSWLRSPRHSQSSSLSNKFRQDIGTASAKLRNNSMTAFDVRDKLDELRAVLLESLDDEKAALDKIVNISDALVAILPPSLKDRLIDPAPEQSADSPVADFIPTEFTQVADRFAGHNPGSLPRKSNADQD